ncbi:MAG: DNA cytosine methyltransferase [Selenomonadaceae bacterium]|nr:DNA cytosine methyltransferase [Selenomonadaceae bacterium]
MNIISLASGAGLWDWAWRDAGANIKLQCENNEIATLILHKAFPEAQHDNDIFTLTKEKIQNVYGINNLEEYTFIGGLCCQPFSTAGSRKGKYKDTWMCDELLRLTRACKPRFVISENVAGFIKHEDGLPYLVPRMEKIGYRGHSLSIPASAFEAPHERQRVFSFFARDKILEHAVSFGRLAGLLSSSFCAQKTIRGYYNGRNISKPGISSVAYGRPTKAEQDYLRILGNGVEYQTGFFIASVIKAINDYFYDSLEGQQLKKIPYNPY